VLHAASKTFYDLAAGYKIMWLWDPMTLLQKWKGGLLYETWRAG